MMSSFTCRCCYLLLLLVVVTCYLLLLLLLLLLFLLLLVVVVVVVVVVVNGHVNVTVHVYGSDVLNVNVVVANVVVVVGSVVGCQETTNPEVCRETRPVEYRWTA